MDRFPSGRMPGAQACRPPSSAIPGPAGDRGAPCVDARLWSRRSAATGNPSSSAPRMRPAKRAGTGTSSVAPVREGRSSTGWARIALASTACRTAAENDLALHAHSARTRIPVPWTSHAVGIDGVTTPDPRGDPVSPRYLPRPRSRAARASSAMRSSSSSERRPDPTSRSVATASSTDPSKNVPSISISTPRRAFSRGTQG